jgi:WD40 repeat protein
VAHLRFSPDGATLAVAGQEPQTRPPGGLVDLIDPRTGARRRRIVLPRSPQPADSIVVDVEFGRGGRELVVEQIHNLPDPSGPASILHRLDARTGESRRPPLRVGRHSAIGMTPSADHRRLFMTSSVDDVTYEIDVRRLRVLRRWPVGDVAGSVSPDGRWFALGSSEGGVRLLDLRSGRLRRFADSPDARILRMRFTPDGRTLVTSAEDGPLIVWDVARGEIRETLSGDERDTVWGLQVAPDGRSVYSAGHDGRAIIWDLAPDRRLDRPFDAGPPFVTDDGDRYPRGLALSPDGRLLALTQADGTVDMVDAHTLRRRASLAALDGFAAAVAFSTDGHLLAVTGEGGQVALFDARTLRPEGELSGLKTTSQAIVFSPDGRLLAAAEVGTLEEVGSSLYTGSSVRIWDVRRRELTGVHFQVTTASMVFSPDSRLLVAATKSGEGTEIRDARDGRLVARLPSNDRVRSVAFAPDGTMLATGQYDGEGRLWSTDTWKPIGPPLKGHVGRLLELEFSRDGTLLASAGADGTVALWDVKTQQRLGLPLTVEADTYIATTFTPDGSRLFAVSEGRRGVRWDVSVDSWKRHACRVAGRDLTAREWRDALPDRHYQAVCASS